MLALHGTTAEIEIGGYLLPPISTGKLSEANRKKNLERVFFTHSIGSARIYAGRAKHSLGGTPRVYVVEPVGDVVCLSDRPGTDVYHAPALRVIKRIDLCA